MALADSVRALAGRVGAGLQLAGRVGARIQSFAQTAPIVDGIGLQPQVPYPNAPPATRDKAFSPDALYGRISYRAGPSHTRYSTYVGTGLSPATVYSVLRDADLGIMYRWADLCEQILERDGHLRSVDRARRVEVSGKQFRVSPANDTRLALQLAKFMGAVIGQIDSFDRTVYQALQANAVGYSLSEIVYANSKVRFPFEGSSVVVAGIFPRQIDWVHPKHLRFDRDTDRPMIDVGNGGIMDLPPDKFIFHPSSGDGFFERRGHMRACVWLHLFKQQCVRDWAVFGALYGIPNIVAKYPRGVVEQTEARQIWEQYLRDFGQGLPIVVPDDFDVKIEQGPSGTGNGAQVQMIGWANTEISKTVQGETLTTELSQTGSYNIGDIHADTKHAIVRDDARGLACDIRSDLFRPVIELNIEALAKTFGASPDDIRSSVPVCSWRIERETTPQQRAQIITDLAQAGLRIAVDQVREEFALDAPADNADVLSGELVTVPKDGSVVGAVQAAGDGAQKATDGADQQAAPKADGDAPKGDGAPVKVELTPSDLGIIVTVNEARAGQGLPPLATASGARDPDGSLTIAQYKAKHETVVSSAASAAEGGTDDSDGKPTPTS